MTHNPFFFESEHYYTPHSCVYLKTMLLDSGLLRDLAHI